MLSVYSKFCFRQPRSKSQQHRECLTGSETAGEMPPIEALALSLLIIQLQKLAILKHIVRSHGEEGGSERARERERERERACVSVC